MLMLSVSPLSVISNCKTTEPSIPCFAASIGYTGSTRITGVAWLTSFFGGGGGTKLANAVLAVKILPISKAAIPIALLVATGCLIKLIRFIMVDLSPKVGYSVMLRRECSAHCTSAVAYNTFSVFVLCLSTVASQASS